MLPRRGTYACVTDYRVEQSSPRASRLKFTVSGNNFVVSRGIEVATTDLLQDNRQPIVFQLNSSVDNVTLNCSPEHAPGLPPRVTFAWYNLTEDPETLYGMMATNSCTNLFPLQRWDKDEPHTMQCECGRHDECCQTGVLKYLRSYFLSFLS
ncbi:hypothetical protein C0Q70_12476 [Pomacea canaliculata]|uniref:Uncharacterized protein n=1 Tax=Pomacea canaliculata TaxID=400727 RepID=A0A2T7P1N7_POMCA|nr:hypothetical protein C0Q70_12476 [Pomacea canaliculata]